MACSDNLVINPQKIIDSQMILAGSVSMSDHFEGNVDAAWQQRRYMCRS